MSGAAWNEVFELCDEYYFMPDIQDYFDYVFRNHKTITDELSVRT